MSHETLFELTARNRLAAGDRVNVRCIWGDEDGQVTEVRKVRGLAAISVRLDRGGVIEVSAGAVRHAA